MQQAHIDFLYLDEEQMIEAGVTDMPSCIDTMEQVLHLLSEGDYLMGGQNGNSHGVPLTFPQTSPFPGMPLAGEDRRFMAMPAYIGGSFDLVGMKWYGSNIANRKQGLPRSILMVMLNDKNTGAPIAHMSGNLISSYRTGAIPGVGAKYLAKKDARVLGIFGPGVMARTTLEAFSCVCPELDTLKIKGRGRKSTESFCAYVRENFPQFHSIEVCDDLEGFVRGCDLMCFAATSGSDASQYPLVKENWVKPGALICAPASVNFEDDFLTNRCRKVVDNMGLYEAWAEEFPYPTFGPVTIVGTKFLDLVHEKKIRKSDIKEIGNIVSGKIAGRKNDEEVIVYSVGGMPVEDVAWGKIVYENAVKKGIGTRLKLWDAPAMG